jgi:hypothetical protein
MVGSLISLSQMKICICEINEQTKGSACFEQNPLLSWEILLFIGYCLEVF